MWCKTPIKSSFRLFCAKFCQNTDIAYNILNLCFKNFEHVDNVGTWFYYACEILNVISRYWSDILPVRYIPTYCPALARAQWPTYTCVLCY